MHLKNLLAVFCALQLTCKLCNAGFLSHGPFFPVPYGIGGGGNSNGGGSGQSGGNNNNNQQQQQRQQFNGAVISAYRYEHPVPPVSSIYRQQIVNSVPGHFVGGYGYGSNVPFYNYGNGGSSGNGGNSGNGQSSGYGQNANSNGGNYGY